MKLEQSFEVAAPLERVWQTLIDVEHVAPCLPGAAVTGRNDDGSYNGTFTVKIGPTTASYTGRLEMESIDEASHSATMQAQGTDKRGQGGAKATIYSRLAPADGAGTRVDVVTDYHITGRLARFGRGGMIEDISQRLLREFATRLQSSLAAQQETVVSQPAVTEAPPPSDVPPAVVAAAASDVPPGPSEEPVTVGEGPPPPPAEMPASPQSPVDDGAPVPPPAGEFTPPPPPPPASPEPEPETKVFGAGAEPGAEPPPPPPPPSPGPPPVTTPPAAPSAVPPPPPGAAGRPPLEHPPQPSEPMQGLSLVGGVVWGRVKRNPAPVAAAAGVAVMMLMARRRRKRHA
jgi:carbon monoxide dehydrogenase subunit G